MDSSDPAVTQLQHEAQQLNHQDVSNGLWAMAALDADLEDQAVS